MRVSELVELVEAASGPDRELDGAIWCALNNEGAVLTDSLPWFTGSQEAAMDLVNLDDAWLEIKGPRRYLNIPTPVPNYWSASLSRWNHEGQVMGWGATPALALVAAALRARDGREG